jgi:uncharacterized tellurite resistance protein B-like protein
MFEYLKKILSPESQKDTKSQNKEKKLQIATCALFVEMAGADDNFTDDERKKIIFIMQKTFDLDENYVKEIIELSEKKVDESVDVYEFTTVINSNFSKAEKFDLLKNLWRLIYVDDNLDKYEDSLVRKIGILLNVEHSDIIAAKIFVKDELKK